MAFASAVFIGALQRLRTRTALAIGVLLACSFAVSELNAGLNANLPCLRAAMPELNAERAAVGMAAQKDTSAAPGGRKPSLHRWVLYMALIIWLICACFVDDVQAQGAAQIGGRPPKSVVTALCTIGDVFADLCAHLHAPRVPRMHPCCMLSPAVPAPRPITPAGPDSGYGCLRCRNVIKTNANCMAGSACARGTGVCLAEWYPGSADECSPECGRLFEPFCERS